MLLQSKTKLSRPFPWLAARSTGTDNLDLLYTLLASQCIDELSNAEDFLRVADYVAAQGLADASNRVHRGMIFWVYPTGLYGPFHAKSRSGHVELHGLLVTVEPGARVEEVIRRIRMAFKPSGIAHEHIAAA